MPKKQVDIHKANKAMTKSRGKPRTYCNQDHRYVRFLFECEGFAMTKISENTEIPLRTIQLWKKNEKWGMRSSKTEEIETFSQQKFLELATENDMPPERATQLLIEGMTKPLTDEQDPDYNTRHKYQKDYWGITGMLGGSKKGIEVNNNGSGNVQVLVQIPEKTDTFEDEDEDELEE